MFKNIVEGIRASTYLYAHGSGQIYGYDYCRGFENSLSRCRALSYSNLAQCNHNNDIGLECEGEVNI